MKNITCRGDAAHFLFPWPFQLFNNLLAETELTIPPSVSAGKREMRAQTFVGQHFSFHLRRQQPCIWGKNRRPWVAAIQAFASPQPQAAAAACVFHFLRTYEVKSCPECWEQWRKWLQKATTCWAIEVQPWRDERNSESTCSPQVVSAGLAGKVAKLFPSVIHGATAVVTQIKPPSSFPPYLIIGPTTRTLKETKHELWLIKSGPKDRRTFTRTGNSEYTWSQLKMSESAWLLEYLHSL